MTTDSRNEVIGPAVDVSFDCVDGKGRALGTRYRVEEFDLVEVPASDQWKSGYYYEPGHYFVVRVQATRNGDAFGPAFNRSKMLTSQAEVDAYIVKYLKGARKTATKRAAIEAARKLAQASKRTADKIDGLDRDDLGESPDY